MKPQIAVAVLIVGGGLVLLIGWMIERGAANVAGSIAPAADPYAQAEQLSR